MLALVKGAEPGELAAYRAVPGATYDGKDFTPVKTALRRALLRDQAALCCYCMRRISEDARPHPTSRSAPPLVQRKVEHWRSQDAFPHLQLAWSNMLGACLGGVAVPEADETCDTRKGELAITLDPLDPSHLATIHCKSSGKLVSSDAQFQRDIDARLNLNHRVLVAERRARLERELGLLRRSHDREIPSSAVQRRLTELETPLDGKRPELCGVLRLWARKRFAGKVRL